MQGRPFVGSAGKQLESLLKDAGLDRSDVFITNIVKCRPPENRRPTTSEAQACRPFLDRQLSLIRPRMVVLLGDTALKCFLPKESLSTAHGKVFPFQAYVVFSTYHPAAMIYDRALEITMRADFRALGRELSRLED